MEHKAFYSKRTSRNGLEVKSIGAILRGWGVFVTDRLTDGQTDGHFYFRVAFSTEKRYRGSVILSHLRYSLFFLKIAALFTNVGTWE